MHWLIPPNILLYFVGALVSLFSIVDPLLAAPVFVSLTGHCTRQERISLARRASFNVFGILTAFFVAGTLILGFFGISIVALRLAGGLMITSSAFAMLNKKERLLPEEEQEAEGKEDIAFSPLAMPLLSGPGAIAVLIGLTTDAHHWMHFVSIFLVIILVSTACYWTLVASDWVIPKLGQTLIRDFTRIMGFILLCVGVQYMVNGLSGVAVDIAKQIGH